MTEGKEYDERYEVRIVEFGGDDYMKSLSEGFEVVDKADDKGKSQRVLRRLKPVPFAFAKLS